MPTNQLQSSAPERIRHRLLALESIRRNNYAPRAHRDAANILSRNNLGEVALIEALAHPDHCIDDVSGEVLDLTFLDTVEIAPGTEIGLVEQAALANFGLPPEPAPEPEPTTERKEGTSAIEAVEPERPLIIVTGERRKVRQNAKRVLPGIPGLYQRTGAHRQELVRVRSNLYQRSEADAPTIVVQDAETLRRLLEDHADWEKETPRKGKVVPAYTPAAPPPDMVKELMTEDRFDGVPWLDGVATAPILRPNLSVCTTPGYDLATRMVYQPTDAFPCVDAFTPEEGADYLEELVADFPFEADHHRAAWIASLLSVIALPAIEGAVPMFLFDAAAPGTGKSMLADITSIIATGRTAAKQSQVDDVEFAKCVLPMAQEGWPLACIDNVAHALGGSALESVITAGVIRGRILGASVMRTVACRMVLLATGNNMEVTRDMQRRVIPVRLVSDVEQPEDRGGFRHENILAHVRENRGMYYMAALAVLRAPRGAAKVLGSFEEWSRVVCGAMVGAGLPDPQDARAAFVSREDPTKDAALALFTAIGEAMGEQREELTAKAMLQIQEITGAARQLATLRPGDVLDAQQLGYVLRKQKDKVIAGLRLEASKKNNQHVWGVFKP